MQEQYNTDENFKETRNIEESGEKFQESNFKQIQSLEDKEKFEKFLTIRKKYKFVKAPILLEGCGVQFLNKDCKVLQGTIIDRFDFQPKEKTSDSIEMYEVLTSSNSGHVEAVKLSKNRLNTNLLDYQSSDKALKYINQINSVNSELDFQTQPEYN